MNMVGAAVGSGMLIHCDLPLLKMGLLLSCQAVYDVLQIPPFLAYGS